MRNVSAFGLVLILAGCAAARNTPAQDLAWERWVQCRHFPTIQLKEIRPNGEIWIFYTDPSPLAEWKECTNRALAEQRRAAKLSASQPVATRAEVQGLVRYAYFTDNPPPAGTYLHSTGLLKNMPPETTEFRAGQRVTFFYAVNQVQRVFNVDVRWTSPSGEIRKTVKQVLDQTQKSGSWVWRTDSLPAADIVEPGEWTVRLLLDGNPIGEYSFTLSPSR